PQVGAEDAAVALSTVPFDHLLQFAVTLVEEHGQGRVDETVDLGGDGVEALGFPEKVHEALGFAVGALDLEEFEEDDGPGDHREEDEDQQNNFDDDAGAGK